jgi:hypothetical protein
MIDAQPLDIVGERVEARCGDHTRLPHGPAKPELPLSRGGDEIVIADEDCADRTAEALGQIEPEAVAELAVLLRVGIAATTAFISRAPSICSDSPDSFTARETSLSAASDQIAPPPRFTVCSK